MFDNLSNSLSKAFKSVSPDGKLTAENIKGPLRDVRRALLEADVSLPVVRRFVAKVEEKALGLEVRLRVNMGSKGEEAGTSSSRTVRLCALMCTQQQQ
jgi:signal recognition particle subunit SRP54